MFGRRKIGVFLAGLVQCKSSFFEISAQARTLSSSFLSSRAVPRLQTGCGRRLAIKLHHSNVRVAIMYSWMNFAVRELRICCPDIVLCSILDVVCIINCIDSHTCHALLFCMNSHSLV